MSYRCSVAQHCMAAGHHSVPCDSVMPLELVHLEALTGLAGLSLEFLIAGNRNSRLDH